MADASRALEEAYQKLNGREDLIAAAERSFGVVTATAVALLLIVPPPPSGVRIHGTATIRISASTRSRGPRP